MSSEEIETATEQPFQQLQRQMNKLVEQMQKGYYNYRPGETWQPNVNLYETDAGYLVCVDLGGVEKDKIEIELIDQRLTIRGNRPVPTFPDGTTAATTTAAGPAAGRAGDGHQDAKKYRVHLMEIDHGPFAREVELPLNVEKDRIAAQHRNGMLWIELPKKKR
jgi:HSP20 family protein